MTPEEREAVRDLVAALPPCEKYMPDNRCGRPATCYEDPHCHECGEREYHCDEHSEFLVPEAARKLSHGWTAGELDYAPALRKLQAMLEPEEKPSKRFVASDVVDALEQDGLRSAEFTYDARRHVVDVIVGSRAATFRIPIDGTETSAELADKIRAVLPKEWKGIL